MHRVVLAVCLFLFGACHPALAQHAAPPGDFDYYLLALSWSPQYCADHVGEAGAGRQCAGPQSFGLVVHGLWPQNENGSYPTACRPAGQVPRSVVARVLPIMPSPRLVQHEWATHGTCSGLTVDDFFDSISRAFRKVQIPPPLDEPHVTVSASVQRVKQLFAEANPGLSADMMTVICSGRERVVSEIHICLTKSLAFRKCGAEQVDTCRSGEARFRPVP